MNSLSCIKVALTAILFIFFSFVFDANAQCATCPKDTTAKYFLSMQGQILFGKKGLDKVFIEVLIDSVNSFKTFQTDEKGNCEFEMPLQHLYVIKFTKYGYVTKIITADTRIPKTSAGDYLFQFSADLFEQFPELDVSILKFPIAKIFFNTFTKKFDYDYNYTAKINKDLKNLYREYYSLKEKNNSGKANSQSKQDTGVVKTIISK